MLSKASLFKIISVTIGSILCGLGFIVPSLWPFVFFGLVPLIAILKTTRSWKKRFLIGYSFGLGVYGFQFYSFFFDSLPFSWVSGSDFGHTQYIIVGLGWMLTIALCSIATALFGALLHTLLLNGWYGVIGIPSLWVVCEWFGSVVLSVGVTGEGSLLGPHITLGYLGNLLASNTILLQFSFFGGIYILSFIVVTVNVLVWHCFQSHTHIQYVQLYTICLLFLGLSFLDPYKILHTKHDPSKELEFLVLGTTIPYNAERDVKDQYHTDLIALLSQEISSSTDVVVFPEGYGYLQRQSNKKAVFVPPHTDPVIIDSTIVNYSSTSSARVMQYYEPKDNSIQYTVKQFLVPIGEYTPTIMYSVAKFFGFFESVEKIERERHSVAGPQSSPIYIREIPIGALFCNEISSPELYRKQTYMGAQILVNVASHSRHHGSYAFTTQLRHAALIRAVENGRPMVVAHDMAPAFVLDEHGQTIAETSGIGTEIIKVKVTPSTYRTPYTIVGSSILFVPGYLVLLFIYMKYKILREEKRKAQ